MSALIDTHCEVHVESGKRWTCYRHLHRVGKVGEFHKVVELVVCGDRAVAKDVCHVGRTENVELSTQSEVLYRTLHASVEVDVCLSECLRAAVLLCVHD